MGLKKKIFAVGLWRHWLQRISCSPGQGSVRHSHRRSGAGGEAIGRARCVRSAAQSNSSPPGGTNSSPLAGRYEANATLQSFWLSISLQLRKSSRRIGLQRCNRGRGGGARESRHVAEAPPKSRLAGKGGPWSPGKEIEWPLALGARSLAAVLEDAARASHSCCTVQTRLGKPAWGICGARRLLSYEVRPTQCSDGRKP